MSWQVALRLGRVSNLPTVWTNVLAGLVLSGGAVAATHTVGIALALSLFYVAGMYLNDAFDREIDARERPERPIPSGQISARTVFASGYAMMLGGVALLALLGLVAEEGTSWRAPAAGLALGATIVFYDWYHKDNPLSPLVMGVCRLLVYVTAGLAVVEVLPARLWAGAALALCYLIGLTYAAKQENLAQFRGAWPLAFLAAPFVYLLPKLDTATSVVIYAGFALWVIYALSLLFRKNRRDVPRAVVSLIAGICLLDAIFVASAGELPLAMLPIAGFGLTLALQRVIPGT